MKSSNILFTISLLLVTLFNFGQTKSNSLDLMEDSAKTMNTPPLVNYDYFEQLVSEVKAHREERLVSLDTFLTANKDIKKVILDTRSKAMYDYKHVKGAIHLNFSDFTQEALDELFLPYQGRNTQIYIYCNNNFFDSKAISLQDVAFTSKMVIVDFPIDEKKESDNDEKKSLALNIPTYINLYGYGYKNVFELNEFIDVNDTRIQFEGTFDD